MALFKQKKNAPKLTPSPEEVNITELLYKRNSELATKNKALSLISHLYQVSIQTLSPSDIAQSVTESVRSTLNYEMVSVFLYDKDKDTISKIGASTSDRLHEKLRLSGYSLDTISIDHVSSRNFFSVIANCEPELHHQFGYVLKNSPYLRDIEKLRDSANLQSSLIYPLSVGDRAFGIFIITLNREYNSLPEYEQEIITSIVNVVSLAIDKSLTYEALHDANEKLEGLDKLKTEFLSLAAHQLRSPLTAIRGYSSMLLEGSFGNITDLKQRDAIDRMFQSSTHLAKIVEDLLNVSKIEQGGMKYEMASFDIQSSLQEIVKDLSVLAQKKGLTLAFVLDSAGPYMVFGDAEKLHQVFQNLIDNAIKYTDTGGVTVHLAKSAQGLIIVRISDTGIGISKEEKERLFEKFSRGAGGKTNTTGSGLGLYLAKQIISAHTGHIAIDSPGVGKGATFIIELKGN